MEGVRRWKLEFSKGRENVAGLVISNHPAWVFVLASMKVICTQVARGLERDGTRVSRDDADPDP